MNWILNNPWDAFCLLWSVIIRPVLIVSSGVFMCYIAIAKSLKVKRKAIIRGGIAVVLLSFVLVAGIRIHAYLNPKLNTQNGQENYAAHFNDVQRIPIAAAQKFGMHPFKDRAEAMRRLKEYNLHHIRSNKNYQLAPMDHSIPYLTNNASALLNTIGENFRDSLASKNLSAYKIVVTSILRTDADVERLMKKNTVALKNSAHRYATTFDISYVQFVPVGISNDVSRIELKKVLAEVLRDLRSQKECYVKYEQSQHCFHITSRK